jgi:hypothetical protein
VTSTKKDGLPHAGNVWNNALKSFKVYSHDVSLSFLVGLSIPVGSF